MSSVQTPTQPKVVRRGFPLAPLARNHNFRLLWLGQGTSLLGDQCYLIALPWLVLKLTGDPLALGTVLALAGLPRALFMLVGGAVTDRFSPRRIMILSDVIRLVLTALLAVLVLTALVQVWMLYVLALLFGMVSGFFLPASNTIMPQLVEKERLQSANALFQGTAQFSVFVGPALAGGVIALISGNTQATKAATLEMRGLAVAFGIDALTFLISVVTLWLLRIAQVPSTPKERGAGPSVLTSIREGVGYVWKNPLLRMLGLIIVAMNFLFTGPLLVGIPYLADTRLPEGAAAFGLILSAYGGGNLLGYVVAGIAGTSKQLGTIASAVFGAFGIGIILLGMSTSTVMAFLILLVLGVGNGYLGITLITWLQRRTPQHLLGRIMSLMLFASYGLVPVAQALCGGLIKWSLTGVFSIAGVLILVVAVRAILMPEIRAMSSAIEQ
jgi:MFS family permease